LGLLHKLLVAVEKTEIIGTATNPRDPYHWDKDEIIAALKEAIKLHLKGKTPNIETIDEMGAALAGGDDNLLRASFGGTVSFREAPIAGLIPLEEGVCLGPGEEYGLVFAMKRFNDLKNGPHFNRVKKILRKDGAIVGSGEEILEVERITEAEFLADRHF